MMTKRWSERMTRIIASWLTLLMFACGPRLDDDDEDAGAPDGGGHDCDDASCSPGPLCGERQLNCAGGLGMGECIDGKCSPVPMGCVGELSPNDTCTEVCADEGRSVVCVENGCDGVTAFGYPGTELEALAVCGDSTPDVREAVVPIEMSCDAPLHFTGEGSFALYQCCCDHPDV
jgi:hypothetical protein